MSLYDFNRAVELYKADEPFYGLIMAAMMKTDDVNKGKMRLLWPEVWNELDARYHARGGLLPEDGETLTFEEP